MPDWNPTLYRRYEGERTRPAAELLARVPLSQAGHVVDLGCGPGNSTELLVQRFAAAQITGVDLSEAMLASARERLPAVHFEQADIARWAPPGAAPDLIYANAALQWVPEHEVLLPRLMAALAPGGVLAIQMPDNLNEPSHRLMREVAAQTPWAAHSAGAAEQRTALLSAAGYYDLLAPLAARVEVWHTVYQHPLASPSAIVDWVRSTGLKPYVEALPESMQASFLSEYESRIDAAYPVRADGQRLLAYPRLFIVAQKAP